jgi:hypothetical protein
MSEEIDREVLRLAWLWVQRFGEPPPILTEPELMRRVLEACPPGLEAAA